MTARSQAWGDIQNTFLLNGWGRLDAFATYATLVEGHKVTAQLNLHNVNNVRSYEAVDDLFNYNFPPFLRTPSALGLAVAMLSVTGVYIWQKKRRARQGHVRRMAARHVPAERRRQPSASAIPLE